MFEMKRIQQVMINRFFQALFALFCGSTVNAQTPDSLNVLFIGNSYTHMNRMPFLFDKIAKSKNKPVHVEMNTHSGFSFREHSERPDMYQAFKSRKWDIVVLQGYSREFIRPYEYLDTASMPYLNGIIDSIKQTSPCAKLLFYQTWGYKDGYHEEGFDLDYDQMTNQIDTGYTYTSAILNIPRVPVGKVWQSFREKNPDVNLYDKDNAHPSKFGSYLTACSFYAAIFGESPEGAITNSIKSDIAISLQKAAADYVLPIRKENGLTTNSFLINKKVDKKGHVKVEFEANYPNALSVFWYLGDGTKTEEREFSYEYKKSGNYKVKLVVNRPCGVQHFGEIINVKVKKPKAKKVKTN